LNILVNAIFTGHKTGVGRVIEGYLKALSRIDSENNYYILTRSEYAGISDLKKPNFHVIPVRLGDNFLLYHLWTQTGLQYQILKKRADLVLLPQINLILMKLRPILLVQHDLIEYRLRHQKWFKMIFRKLALPIAFKKADRIVCVSDNTRRDMKRLFKVPDEKIMVIHDAVDLSLFGRMDKENAKAILRGKYGIKDKFILYTGTLTLPQKNLLKLVHAFKLLSRNHKGLKLVLVGGKGKDSHLIFERVEELGLTRDVIFAGYVPDQDLLLFYNGAEAFCFPSLYEGFGLPVLEAMACECPVVCSNTSSLPDVAGGAALLADPDREEDIADALLKLLRDKGQRERCIEKGIKRASEFSWDSSAEALLRVINEMKDVGLGAEPP
jgi:glycosyltransferase involved in cell wall biosynthesis